VFSIQVAMNVNRLDLNHTYLFDVSKYRDLIRSLGPGLLYAGAAIGVSHLVQSTRAGANFGALMIFAVLAANILKYPFFEFGPRYVAATGHSILHGYKKVGAWAPWLFIILTILTMFTVQAAITSVTAGLAQEMTGFDLASWKWGAILLAIASGVLLIGKYGVLDRLMKYIIVGLALTTIIALLASQNASFSKVESQMIDFNFSNEIHIYFLIALVGWMPAPVDIAVWHSVWSVAKNKSLKRQLSLNESLFDFKLGFWGTAMLAVAFVLLGSTVLYGSGEELASSGSGFAAQLIGVYTSSIGAWAYPFIALAAFTTMISTTITCLDAFPRVLGPAFDAALNRNPKGRTSSNVYQIVLIVLVIGTLVLMSKFSENMKGLVDLATSISFMTAPFLAWLNLKSVISKEFPAEFRPGIVLRVLSVLGLIFLLSLGGYFFYLKFS